MTQEPRGGVAKQWYLQGVVGRATPWVVPLRRFPFTVGRQSDCDLALFAKTVSRHHAEIVERKGVLYVRDLRSANGTYVNCARVGEECRLKEGDVLHFGSLEFRLKRGLPTPAEEGGERLRASSSGAAHGRGMAHFDALYEMLSEQAVVPCFQPVVELATMECVGYEVLGRARLNGLPSSPRELFSIASCLGAEAELSRLFRAKGVEAGRSIKGAERLFVNAHPAEVCRLSLVESLREVRAAAPRLRLVLEIPERCADERGVLRELRTHLADLEIGLAYDGFAGDHRRFLDLLEVPPDYIKFNRRLIGGLPGAPRSLRDMVCSLVAMARDLGIETVAVGVECREEFEFCAGCGFSHAQGFYFGVPAAVKWGEWEEVGDG